MRKMKPDLRSYRKQQGWTMDELADHIQVSRTIIHRAETGQQVSFKSVHKIATGLGWSYADTRRTLENTKKVIEARLRREFKQDQERRNDHAEN